MGPAPDENLPPLPHLSRPTAELRDHYEVVVVGSGYGGSIAASRLARAGRKVALFERGREIHPGGFPRTALHAATEMQVTLAGVGDVDRQGLFWFHTGGDVSVLSGCGLGGTSLINANVSLEAAPAVLDDPAWPARLRADRAGLDDGYGRARSMLEPTPFPASRPEPLKVGALRTLAGDNPFSLTPINVTFERRANAAGVVQEACNGCGDCVTGCNYGAKNTLLMNYLPDAADHGAAIFCGIDVRWVAREETGWAVMVQPLDSGRDVFDAEPLRVRADMVVLAAGALGSTALLMRSRERGLAVSDRLGERFSGNGDVLAFALRPGLEVDGVGAGDSPPPAEAPPGPCITSVIDLGPGDAGPDGMIVEDAVIPGALASLVPGMLTPQGWHDWFHHRHDGPWSWLVSALTHGRHGFLQELQTFLVMGNDDDGGRVELDHGEARVVWPGAGTTPYYEKANRRLAEMTARADGRFFRDPLWSRILEHRLVTVHPLGGCAMADDAADGVVDDAGRVYSAGTGTAVHDGLFVWDGSIIPRPVGVNPLLTISALAERAVAVVAAEKGWTVDYGPGAPRPGGTGSHPAAGSAALPGPAGSPGLTFTERMSGHWSPTTEAASTTERFTSAEQAGEGTSRTVSFVLTMYAPDVRRVVADLATPMAVAGTVDIPEISGEALSVQGGEFRLLVADDADETSLRHMRYDLPLRAPDGSEYHLSGFKVVKPGRVGDLWPDTSTLYSTIRRGGADGEVIGVGVLHIAPVDFARQLRTMSVTGELPETERLELLARFGLAFAGPLFHDYGTVVAHPVHTEAETAARYHRPLRVPAREVHPYRTEDGLDLRLTRHRGGERGPVVLVHGMGANPLTFSLDTISPNLVEYLTARGFDVWLQEWRASTLLESCRGDFDADQVARLDHPAAERWVREVTGQEKVHWVTHCVGSMTWMMSTLGGWTTPASLLLSQVGAHPVAPRITRFKAAVHAAGLIGGLGVSHLTTDSPAEEDWEERAFDEALRLEPIPDEERCEQSVCRRLAFIYGVAVHHAAVDQHTHDLLHELFGTTNMQMMSHLSECTREQRLVSASGGDIYLPHVDRLAGVPVTLVHGERNGVWEPASTELTHDWLAASLGPDLVRRVVIPGHGHQDCFMGATAARDVFGSVVEHLERAGA